MCVLRIVNADDRLTMGYLYQAIQKSWEEMVNRFQKRKKRFEPYLKILDAQLDRQLHKNLHATGFWLNPKNQYNSVEMEKHKHTKFGLIDVVEKYAHGDLELRSSLTSELKEISVIL